MIAKRLGATVAALGVAALLFPASVMAQAQTGQTGQAADRVRGQKLSRADFDRCNQQAMQIAGIRDAEAPAAMPGTATTPGTPGTATRPGTATTPGTTPTPGTTGMERTPGTTGTTTPGATATERTPGVGTQPGTAAQPGVGAQVGQQQELDRIVQAYRSCLQQAKN